VKLGVVAASGGRVTWMDLTGFGDDFYLARVHWTHDGKLLAEIQNREQTTLTLVRFDARTGKPAVLLEERSEVWINLHSLLRPLGGEAEEGARLEEFAGHFIWASEASGFRHLYLHDAEGKRVRAITSGEWMVDGLSAIDEESGKLWFTATKAGPTERHLYETSLEGGEPRRITEAPGMHAAVIDHAHERFVDLHNARDRSPSATLRSLADGSEIRKLPKVPDPREAQFDLAAPKLVELQSRDGVTLHGAIYQPDPKVHGDGPYPTIVSVYGGPHAQRVTNSWGLTVDMRSQYLRERGYLVFRLDNRGSARRGLAFEGAIKHDMGNLEVQDQVDGVNWLVEQRLTDPKRVAIYGWSYGGYMAAMALARAPETFQVAVAGAPVTHWDGYDTHYTERYMGTPKSNPDGYEISSVMHHVEKIDGDLLLVHGLIDENVHFRHTARLIDALIRHRKRYELALFPNERHSPRRPEDRVFMEEQIFEFLARNLDDTAKNESPPASPREG
jgi:dipeptidyl-peptidase-4